MIDDVLEIIKDEIETFLKLKMRDNQEQYVKLVPVVDMEGKAAVQENAVCMSLVKIEEDSVNMSNNVQFEQVNNSMHKYNAAIKLNLYVLFSAAYIDGQEKNYKEALKRLSQVISFFQTKRVFNAQNTPRLDNSYGKIKVDLCSQGMEEQNNLWSMLGSLYRPSVMYRLRAFMVQEHHVIAVEEPTTDVQVQLKGKMKYRKILAVDILHQYFAQDPRQLFRIESIPPCEKQKKRCKRFLRPGNNSFTLLDAVEVKDKTAEKAEASQTMYIDTAVYPLDPLFPSYSNLDLDYKQGSIYYIGNDTAIADEKDKEKRLTLLDRGSGETYEGVQVWLRPKQFVLPIDPAPWEWYKLTDRHGNQVKTWTFYGNENADELYVDLKRWPAGLYLLQKNSNIAARFYVSDGVALPSSISEGQIPAFIIGIGLDKAVAKAAQSPTPVDFQVEVNSRMVSWQYHVLARSNNRKLSDLIIKNKNTKQIPDIRFIPHRIDEEQREAVFISDNHIPLTQQGYKDIELFENQNSSVPLIPHMPNADMRSIHIDNQQWISQIYVNI